MFIIAWGYFHFFYSFFFIYPWLCMHNIHTYIPGFRFLLEFDLASSICKTDPVWGSNFTPWWESSTKRELNRRTISINWKHPPIKYTQFLFTFHQNPTTLHACAHTTLQFTFSPNSRSSYQNVHSKEQNLNK